MDTARLAVGSLGPRLAGRLTAELILRSSQYMNCVKEYEIDLRGAAARHAGPQPWMSGCAVCMLSGCAPGLVILLASSK